MSNNSNNNPPLNNTDVTSAKRWVLASNNQGKLAEFKRLFKAADLDIEFVPQAELNIEDAVENGLSFVENAIIKARHASRLSGLPALADDSGLCVPILGNAPGIYSARYAGTHGDSQSNNEKLLADLLPLRDLPSSNLSSNDLPSSDLSSNDSPSTIKAYFVCVLVMVRHANDPLPIIAQGLWQGEIADSPKGDNGFGYDPIFWLPEFQKTAAQLDSTTKNKLSHRGQAIQALLSQLTSTK